MKNNLTGFMKSLGCSVLVLVIIIIASAPVFAQGDTFAASGLGFVCRPDSTDNRPGAYEVVAVEQNSPAWGVLRVNDMIVMINNRDVLNISRYDAHRILNSSDPVMLRVVRVQGVQAFTQNIGLVPNLSRFAESGYNTGNPCSSTSGTVQVVIPNYYYNGYNYVPWPVYRPPYPYYVNPYTHHHNINPMPHPVPPRPPVHPVIQPAPYNPVHNITTPKINCLPRPPIGSKIPPMHMVK